MRAATEGPRSRREPLGAADAAAQQAEQADLGAEEGTATFAGMTFLSSGFIGADTERKRLSALVKLHGGELADEPALCAVSCWQLCCSLAAHVCQTLAGCDIHLGGIHNALASEGTAAAAAPDAEFWRPSWHWGLDTQPLPTCPCLQRPEGDGWCLVATQQSKTLKFLLAHLHGMPIVKPQWVWDSVRAQRPLTYADPTKVMCCPCA